MAERLVIDGNTLQRGLASLEAARLEFGLIQDRTGESANACGHAGLAGALRKSASNWSTRRGKLTQALENLVEHMRQSIKTFEEVDKTLAKGVSGEETPSPTSQAPQGGSGQQSASPQEAPPAGAHGSSAAPAATGDPSRSHRYPRPRLRRRPSHRPRVRLSQSMPRR